MKKRITALLLAVVLVAGGSLSKVNTFPVYASSAPLVGLDAAAAAELLAFLSALMGTAAVAAGIDSGLGTFTESQDVLAAFQEFVNALGPDLIADELTVTLADGSVVTYEQLDALIEFVNDTDGSSALAQDMTEEEAAAYRELIKSKLKVLDGGGSSGENPDDGGGNKLFAYIKSAIFSSVFVKQIGDFFSSIFRGEVEEIDPYSLIYPYGSENFTGYEMVEVAGSLRYNIDVWISTGTNCSLGANETYYISTAVGQPPFLYVTSSDTSADMLVYAGLYDQTNSNAYTTRLFKKQGGGSSYKPYAYFGADLEDVSIDSNIPIFESLEDANSFFADGDTTLMTNGTPLNNKKLSDAISSTLSSLSDTELDPDGLVDLNNTLVTAAGESLDSEPGESENATDAYQQTIQDTVTDAVPDIEVQPDAEPEPDAGTETEPEPEPATEVDIDDYKLDLTMIFPFCLPFDLIRIFEALAAEPEAPVFHFPFRIEALGIDMTADIDLSIFDEVMEIFRLGELISFIIALISITHKMIKW